MNAAQVALLKKVAPRPVLKLARRWHNWRMAYWNRKANCLVDMCYEKSQAGAHYMTGQISATEYNARLIAIDRLYKQRKRNHFHRH